MRSPSFLAQCFPGLLPHDRGSHSSFSALDKDSHFPAPAVEIFPSKLFISQVASPPSKNDEDNIDAQGLHVFKGKINVAYLAGFGGTETICPKTDVSVKLWDSSMDLVSALKFEICDGQLSFRGKRVLELSCSYGVAGIFACLKGASTVHFQDPNAEAIRCATIPNVVANLERARDWQSRQPEGPLTPSRQPVAPAVHFYAGDWGELPTVLSVVKNDIFEATPGMSMCFSEEDFNDACSSQDGSITGVESSAKPRRSRKLSRSQAWERASEVDRGDGGYDVILMSEIPHSVTSLKKLYELIKKCLRPPYGVLYMATKKNCVSYNNGARHLRHIVDDEGILGAHLVTEMSEREIWKFFHK